MINRKVKQLSLLLLASAVLSACTSPHKCKLGDECTDVYDVYGAAVAHQGNKESLMLGSSSNKPTSGNSDTLGIQGFEPYSGGKMTEKPLYQPPRPLRIWIAPWRANLNSETQADLVLMSGQFMYATIPGYWTAGELRDDGELGGMTILEPYEVKEEVEVPNRIQPRTQVFELPSEVKK